MPLLQPTLTRSADGLLHLYRVVALEHALQQGQTLFPRWLPDLAFGYGFPLFVFYAPLSYYVTLALSYVGAGPVLALNASFILALFLAGTGAYLFIKELFGPEPGLLAAVAYVYAPFQLLNTLSRGGLPAAWAMAAFPFVFWIFSRLINQRVAKIHADPPAQNHNLPQPGLLSLVAAPLVPVGALIFGAALLMHNTLSLLFVPLLALYLALHLSWVLVKMHNWRVGLQVGLTAALGVGLAAFFLLPAIAEKDFAQVQRVITSPNFDFRFNFVTLRQLLSLPPPANTGLLNPHYPLTLGLPQAVLAAIGLIGLGVNAIKNPPRSPLFLRPILFFTFISLTVTIFMMLPISVTVWERLPLLAFVQFPHRLLGPAALVLALLAGAAIAALPPRAGFGLTLTGIILIFIASVPLLYPRYHNRLPARPLLPDMMAYEHASGTIGTTSFGEYLPIWVEQVPRESPLEPMYRAGATIKRLDPAYLPQGTQIEQASYGFNRVNLVINAPEPYQAIFHTFYFPGWQAQIDSQPAPVAPATERGLIGVNMPAGRHRLALVFEETSLRRVANGVSVAALAMVLILPGVSVVRRSYFKKAMPTQFAIRNSHYFNRQQIRLLAILALLLIGAKGLYFDRFDTPLKRTFDGETVAGAGVSKKANFGGQINLLGYTLERSAVMPGQNFDLTVYWQACQPLNTNYSALAQLVDAQHHLYAGQDNLHPGSFKTTLWQPWGFVQDPHAVTVPPGTPPGDYFLVTGLYNPATWARLPVVDGGDPRWSDVVAIPVGVTRPARQPTLAQLGIAWPVRAHFGAHLRLLGATPERRQIVRSDFWRVALFWEAKTAPAADYAVSLRLVAADGSVAMQQTTRPSYNRYPTTQWFAGERVRDNHALWIPADFPAGVYRVQVRVVDEAGRPVGNWVELGRLPVVE